MAVSSRPVAIVTGGARGIGRAIVEEVARGGYAVVVNSVSGPDAGTGKTRGEVVAEAVVKSGGVASACRGDIGNAGDRERLVDFALATYGRIDLLVNNAGIAPPVRADVLEASEASFDVVVGTNLKGPYFLTQRVGREMVRLRKEGVISVGRVCFVTSISAYTSSTNRGEYCVSKAGLSMAARVFADRLAGEGCVVIEVRPGVIETDMTAGVKEKYDRMFASGVFPQGRWGRPADVARVVGAFGRGDLDYSTGMAIDVSGGFQMKRL